MSLYQVVAVVLVFGLLIALHEAGHFVAARLNGVRVLEFSIGFGPQLLKWQRPQTMYSLRIIPLGGYVRLAGIDDETTGPESFNSKSVWRRVTIIAAGATTNLVLAAILFGIAAAPEAGAPVRVGDVVPDKPAAHAGLHKGDLLVSANGRPIRRDQDFREVIGASRGRVVVVKVDRGGASRDFVLAPVAADPAHNDNRLIVGIVLQGSFDLVTGMGDGLVAWREALVAIPTGIYDLASGKIRGGIVGPCGLSGPVGIVRATATAADAGIVYLIGIAAFISLNLGILNLLPLPALDGGRLLFLGIEVVRRKAMNPELEQRVHYIGLVVLLALVAAISYKDILQTGTPLATLVQQCR